MSPTERLRSNVSPLRSPPRSPARTPYSSSSPTRGSRRRLASRGSVNTLHSSGRGGDWENEVDELINWTDDLDLELDEMDMW